ncbi:hypothetical protein ACS0TY_020180 [Phlomoides rotata]
MIKELSLCTSLNLGKPSYLSTERGPLLGRGILSSNGLYWAHQRKIIAPEFYLDRVKGMVSLIAESTSTMVKTWETKIESSEGKAEVRIDEDLRSLSADIISRACFGRSYAQGEKIFTGLQSLQRLMSKGNIGIPGLRHLPTKHNKEIWKLERDIDSMILDVVKSRSSDDDNNKKDLLQLLLGAAENYGDGSNIPADITPNKFIVDNCKSIYFAGHETTAISASWCLMTLAAYPDWQARAREEVLGVCGTNLPTADMLRNMKVVDPSHPASNYGDSRDATTLPTSCLCCERSIARYQFQRTRHPKRRKHPDSNTCTAPEPRPMGLGCTSIQAREICKRDFRGLQDPTCIHALRGGSSYLCWTTLRHG